MHKHNVLVNAGGLWHRMFEPVAAEYPEVTTDYLHVDAATIFLVTDPARFDVIVTDNLFGDILTDLAAAVTGGIGLAASGNINPDRRFPSMFEPVHGSAPDIAGQGIADPTATILSVALLLDHLGLSEEAARIEKAVLADVAGAYAGRGADDDRDRRRDRRARLSGGAQERSVDQRGGRVSRASWPRRPIGENRRGMTECSLRARRRGLSAVPDGWRRAWPATRRDTSRTWSRSVGRRDVILGCPTIGPHETTVPHAWTGPRRPAVRRAHC